MQTVDLRYNVPVGLSLEDFVDKVNAYVARLAKRCQAKKEECDYGPNEETQEAMREAQERMEAYKRGEEWATQGAVDTSSVEAMLKSCGI